MSRGRWITAIAAVALLTTPAAHAQQETTAEVAKPLLSTPFTSNDVNGWKTLGNNAKTSVVKDETRPGADKNVLQFDYSVAKGDMNILYLGTNENEITAARSFRCALKVDYATTLALTLQEKDGGRYIALFHMPAGKWQNVVLSPSDFLLSRDANDPTDANGKLDLDLVQFVGVADIGQFFAQTGDANVSQVFNLKTGAHSIWVSDFAISRQPVSGGITANDARLDAFVGPQVSWLATGGVEVNAFSGKPLEGRGIVASYRQSADRISGLIKAIPQGKLAGKTGLRLTLASAKPATIVIQLEERGGGKYNTAITVPPGSVATPFTIKFADLKASQDSKDDNNQFDADKVYQIVVIDLTGLLERPDVQNTLYLGDLRIEP